MSFHAACFCCKKGIAKYKCPKCLQRTCSLSCYKLHKDADACKTEEIGVASSTTANNASITADNPPKRLLDYGHEEKDLVPPEKLRLLSESECIRNKLKNPHLRSLLTNLDADHMPDRKLRQFMKEPLFSELARDMLQIVEPEKYDFTEITAHSE